MKTQEQDALDWFEVLCGRSPPDVEPKTRREAEILRAVLLSDSESPVAPEESADPAGLARLLDRARREGVLESPQRKVSWWDWFAGAIQRHQEEKFAWLTRFSAPIAVAATVMLGVFVLMRTAVTPELETDAYIPRGGSTPQVVFTDDPANLVAQMKEECLAAGLACEVMGTGSVKALEIRLPKQSDSRSAAFLRPNKRKAAFFSRYEIKPVPNGVMLVEVRPKTNQ